MNGLIAFAPMHIKEDGMYLTEPEVKIPSADQLLEMTNCSKKHRTPQENCYCGIHLTLQPRFIKTYTDTLEFVEVLYPYSVLGIFFIFGSVIFETDGNIRAQKASLTQLVFPVKGEKVQKLTEYAYSHLRELYLGGGNISSFPACAAPSHVMEYCQGEIFRCYHAPGNLGSLYEYRRQVPETFLTFLKESWRKYQ